MIITLIITLLLVFFSIKKPMYALAMILQSNLVRALPHVDLSNVDYHDVNPQSVYFTIVLPYICYFIIFIVHLRKKSLKYVVDFSDTFFLLSIVIMFFYSFVSSSIVNSITYFFQYVLIGLPFYYLSKLFLFNIKQDVYELLKDFFAATIVIAIIMCLIALYVANHLDFLDPMYHRRFNIRIARVSVPGVIPLVHAQTIGFAIVILFCSIYTNGKILKIPKSRKIVYQVLVLMFLVFNLFLANARGLILSTVVALIIFLVMYPRKISKRVKYILTSITVGATFYVIKYTNIEALFGRLLNTFNKGDGSIVQRNALYDKVIKNITSNPIFGLGTNGFENGYYPHNIFLDYILSFGLLGWVLSIALIIVLFYMFFHTVRLKGKHPLIVLLFALVMYFFIETLFSFTLWMHKGFYLSIGIFMLCKHLIVTNRISTISLEQKK